MRFHQGCNHEASVREEQTGKFVSRCFAIVLALPSVVVGLSRPGVCQTSAELQSYFTRNFGLNQDQVKEIHKGKPVIKVMKSRAPADIIIFGAIYINATPEKYIGLYNEFDGLRTLGINLAAGKFSNPPAASDLVDVTFWYAQSPTETI